MARYTDIDKLIAEYDRVHIGPAGGARKLMVEAPIADVVPRAEVEKIFEEIEKILDDSTIVSSSDWGRPYFNITNFRYGIFRLKTKYKEGQK